MTELKAWRTDESLVLAARTGDGAAKAMLFRRNARAATDLAYRLLGRDGELEDVVQQSFVAVFSGLSKLAEPQAFQAWLAAIVTRTAIATIWRRRLLARLGFIQADPIQMEAISAPNAPPDVLVELEAVYRSLDLLPAAERVVLVLRRIEQLGLDDIAQQARAAHFCDRCAARCIDARARGRAQLPTFPRRFPTCDGPSNDK